MDLNENVSSFLVKNVMAVKPNRRFFFHPSIREIYTNGSCEDLADALPGEKYGVQVRFGNQVVETVHYVSKIGPYYVDIEGTWTQKRLIKRFEYEENFKCKSYNIFLSKSDNPVEDVDVKTKLISNLILLDIVRPRL